MENTIYASFKQRFIAYLIDFSIFFVPTVIIMLSLNLKENEANLLINIMALLLTIYSVYFVGKFGQTIGKKIMKIKVVNEETQKPPGLVNALLREVPARWISSIILCTGYLSLLWDYKKRAWHDKIMGTVVVSTN